MTESTSDVRTLGLPAAGLVLLVGVSGSGKSTFAAAHFKPTEVISSDFCRALVSDDESDQSATSDAFDVLNYIVGTRLRRGLLTVVDATNVQTSSRASLIKLAKSHDVLVDAIVFDVDLSVVAERTARRTDRAIGAHVIERQYRDLHQSMRRLRKEGFRRVHTLTLADSEAVQIRRERSWNDRTDLHGPFDIIGDVHGCATELRTLLTDLGWQIMTDGAADVGATHPDGRRAVFVGDLVDRGPDTPGVLRLVMGMVASGDALCVSGNHEAKLVKALKGANVKVAHGLAESLAQLADESEEFRTRALSFMDGLISHYVLDDGNLVVAHAGIKEAYHGRSSGRVRAFCLYGDTTSETDEFGLPVRYPWAQEYRGRAMVVYGHTPVPAAEWINNTICLDTGVVFGGSLTALRYPEREIVSVPAQQEWYEPVRPLVPAGQDRDDSLLRITDVVGTRWLESAHGGKIKIPEENAAAALEVMTRFAVDPRWLVYLPPTMSPVATSQRDEFLEHPDEAFAEYTRWGITRVVCEEKHMGSRAIAVLALDPDAAMRRFGVCDGSMGAVYTRTGRSFFSDTTEIVDRLAVAAAPLFDSLNTDWLVLDCELLPWSVKAEQLIKDQYASVGAAARTVLPEAIAVLERARERGLDVGALVERTQTRLSNAQAFRDAYAAYVRPTDGLGGVTVAPFQILACEGRLLAGTEPHTWHLDQVASLDDPLITPTRHRLVDLSSEKDRRGATEWWLELTAAGGEGIVVKPADLAGRRVQPGIKVRGREYLRIIYGPDYTGSLDVLRQRHLGKKRQLALREHALGLDALAALVAGEPLWKVHQAVFAVLALESEPIDPRL